MRYRMQNIAMLCGRIAATALLAGQAANAAAATETITYSYDAKGRLTKVVRAPSGSGSVTTEYEHDRVNNRTRAKTTGSSNSPP